MKKKFLTYIFLFVGTLTMNLNAQEDHTFNVVKNLDVFHNIYRNLDAYYVDTLDADKVIKIGIDAMLNSLDPYTEYYAEQDESELKMLTQAKYGGIGSIIRMMKDSTIIIAEPYEGMPAAEAGLKIGDILLKIDNHDLKGKDTQHVSNLLRGEPGTTFMLKFQRPGENKPREIKITRQNIKLPAVPYYGMMGDNGYINLRQFTNDCYSYVRKAIISLKEDGAKNLILDLRGNPGGALDQAVRIVGLFVPKGTKIVETKGKVREGNQTYTTLDQPLDEEIPIVVLVNGNSASASEIVAGSLQDLDRAVVVGARTYGKGLVQSIRELPYNGNLKLTTAKYYIPSGRCIQEIDYKQRRETASNTAKKDSTTTNVSEEAEYKTQNGRPVRSGKGIKPDVEVEHDSLQNIVYYLANDDVLINYGTRYVQTHPAPTSVTDFKLTDTDFEEFKKMAIESGFKYDRLSEKRLQDLKKVAEFEGYYEDAKAEFDALEAKLTHNLSKEIDHHAKDIRQLISIEIIKRYFYESGTILETLKDDTDLEKAQEILASPATYRQILTPATK